MGKFRPGVFPLAKGAYSRNVPHLALKGHWHYISFLDPPCGILKGNRDIKCYTVIHVTSMLFNALTVHPE